MCTDECKLRCSSMRRPSLRPTRSYTLRRRHQSSCKTLTTVPTMAALVLLGWGVETVVLVAVAVAVHNQVQLLSSLRMLPYSEPLSAVKSGKNHSPVSYTHLTLPTIYSV